MLFLQQAFSVASSNDKKYDIKWLWNNTAVNYGLEVIRQIDEYVTQRWKELQKMSLFKISNIRAISSENQIKREGLLLSYRSGNSSLNVEFDLSNGQEVFSVR